MSNHHEPSLFDDPDSCPTCGRRYATLSDEGKVGRDHPETSRSAAKMPGKKSEAITVLRYLTSGDQNAGSVARRLGRSPNQVATRMMELREAGLAERVLDGQGKPVKTPTPSGGTGILHRVTDRGYGYLRKIDVG